MQNTHDFKFSSLTAKSPSSHSHYQHPRHHHQQNREHNNNKNDSDMANAATANRLANHSHDDYGSIHNLHGLSTASLASAFASLSSNRNNVSGSYFHSFSPSVESQNDRHGNVNSNSNYNGSYNSNYNNHCKNGSDAFSALLLSSLSQMNHSTSFPRITGNDPFLTQRHPPSHPSPPSAKTSHSSRSAATISKRKAKLADFASLLSSARHAGTTEPVVGAAHEEWSGFFAVRRPPPAPSLGRNSLAPPPPSISCSSLVLRRRSRGNGKGRKKGSGGVRNRDDGAGDGERPAVLEMAVPFYTTPDTASVTPKTILTNFLRSMEELMESRWKARGAESSGDRPFEMGTVMTRFERMSSSDSSSSSFDGNDQEREQSRGDDHEDDGDLTSIGLRFRATLDVRICDRVETVEVTAPVTLSGKFESSSCRAAEPEEDRDFEDDHEDDDDDDHLLAAVDLTFDCVRLLKSMIGRAGELVDLAVTKSAERAISPRGPQHQAGVGAVPSVTPLVGTVGDAGSLLAGLALNAAPGAGAAETDHAHGRTPSHNSLDSDSAWRIRAAALLGMGNYPSTKTLGTVDTLRTNASGSSSGSGDTRVSGIGHRDDDYGNVFKELGSSSGSLSSETFQRALAALSRSQDSRGLLGTAGVASGATLASLSSSALAGNGRANGYGRHNNYRNNSSHINNNNLDELAVSDLTKSYLGSLLSLASFGDVSSNSNSLRSFKDLEHFSFGSFLPSCSSSLNARARPVGGGGTRTCGNNNNNYYNRNAKGENEFLSLSRRLGLKPPSSSANGSRKSNHPSNPTSSANHRRTSLSMMQHDDGSGNANATFDSSLTQLLAAAASNVTGSTSNNGAMNSNPIGIKTNNVVRFSDNTNFLKTPSSPTPTWSRASFGGGGLGLAQKYPANVHGTNGVAASDGSANMAPSSSNAAGSLPQKMLMNSLMHHSGSNNPLLQLAQQQQLPRQPKQEAHVKMPGQQEPRDRSQSKQKPQSQQQQKPQSQQPQQQPVQPKSSNIHQGLFSWLENDSMFLSEEQLKEQDAIDAELEKKRCEAPMPLRFFTAAEEGGGDLEMVGETLFGNGKKGKKNTGISGNTRKKRKTS